MKNRTLQIDPEYSIVIGSQNVTLKYISTKAVEGFGTNRGKETYPKDYWYYPNVKLALVKYLNQSTRYSKDIEDIINRIEKAEAVVEDFFKNNKI